MSISKFVYDSIIKKAVEGGASDSIARRFADVGARDYDRSSFLDKSVGQMIARLVGEAVKQSKAANRVSATTFIPSLPVKPKLPKPATKRQAPIKLSSARNDFTTAATRNRKMKSDCGLWSKEL